MTSGTRATARPTRPPGRAEARPPVSTATHTPATRARAGADAVAAVGAAGGDGAAKAAVPVRTVRRALMPPRQTKTDKPRWRPAVGTAPIRPMAIDRRWALSAKAQTRIVPCNLKGSTHSPTRMTPPNLVPRAKPTLTTTEPTTASRPARNRIANPATWDPTANPVAAGVAGSGAAGAARERPSRRVNRSPWASPVHRVVTNPWRGTETPMSDPVAAKTAARVMARVITDRIEARATRAETRAMDDRPGPPRPGDRSPRVNRRATRAPRSSPPDDRPRDRLPGPSWSCPRHPHRRASRRAPSPSPSTAVHAASLEPAKSAKPRRGRSEGSRLSPVVPCAIGAEPPGIPERRSLRRRGRTQRPGSTIQRAHPRDSDHPPSLARHRVKSSCRVRSNRSGVTVVHRSNRRSTSLPFSVEWKSRPSPADQK